MENTVALEKKRVNISQKRQITIPQKFYQFLGFSSEAECEIRGSELIIRPVHSDEDDDFSSEILADLIEKGLSGKELLAAFNEKKQQIKPAVTSLLRDADMAAKGLSEYETMQNVFGEE